MLRGILLIGALLFATASFAEEQPGYISDDIYVFIHGGPGNQYRILGSIEAGQKVTLLGETEDDFSKIIDHKGREGWVKSEFLTTQSTFRYQIDAQQAKLDEAQQQLQNALSSRGEVTAEIDDLKSQLAKAQNSLAAATKARDDAQQQLASMQDDAKYKMWREGGIIGALGALIAVILVYLPRPRAKKRDRWF